VYVHKHRSALSSDQFFFHDLFLQSRDEKFKSPTVNINYEGNLQNSQVLPPNSTSSQNSSPPQLSHHYVLLHSCFSSLSVSLSVSTIQTRRADHSDLVDGHTSRHCWRARRECCSLLLGSGWNLGPHGRAGIVEGNSSNPNNTPIDDCDRCHMMVAAISLNLSCFSDMG
jgi:hypothetical protein